MSASARPLIVVGSGIAGLTVALAAAPRPVCLLSRVADGLDSASVLAQGGIAVAIGPNDSVTAHAHDTLVAGAFHNHPPAVRRLVEQAASALRWLQHQGVSFDQDGQSLHRAREGGHGLARVVHAGGDASGRVLMEALVAQARRAGHIHWRHGVDVDGLLLRGGSVAGVGWHDDHGRAGIIESADVVLATGGLGALFSATSNPTAAEGAGLALGLAAGATGRDLEFVQFHPTALAVAADGRLPLLTEALRGAGAILRDGQGRALMAGRHPLADLAPRDLVARRVWQALAQGVGAFLHAQHLGDDWPLRFPTVLASCLAYGVDPRRQPMPVTPAAHFHMGGLATDLDGRTSVPGLWAVGEVACNGVHGANRLASNSLLEAVVFGRGIGRRLATVDRTPSAHGKYRLVERGPGATPERSRELRKRLWRDFGPERDAAAISAAVQAIDPAHGREVGWQEQLAGRLLRAGLQRRDSLGAHWRGDCALLAPACAGLPA